MATIMHVHVVRSQRIFLVAAALALALPAHAADLAVKAPPPAAPTAYNWTGLYGGANFGGAFTGEDVTTPFGNASTDPSGALGGGQIGYNFQFAPSWLAGIEAEFDGTTARGTTSVVATGAQPGMGTALSITADHNWYGTLSGRLGYLSGAWLFYAKGGAAWMNADYQIQVNSGTAGASSLNTTRTGWNIGAGVEYMLTPRWSAKVEYDYLDFGSSTLNFAPVGGGTTFRTQVNEVKAGVNYHFNGL
jgi:outer membrane autotransporter protein